MDYEKAYKDLTKKIKDALADQEVSDADFGVVIGQIAPELAESEDERIRKQLLWLCNEWEMHPEHQTTPADEDNIRKIRDWLEKQKEQKPAEWSEEDEGMLDIIVKIFENNHADSVFGTGPNGSILGDAVGTTRIIRWLKSLRPQSNQQTLSEKELVCLKRILDFLRKEHNRYNGEDFTNEIAVLEWMVTHPTTVFSANHWKPTSEQMYLLNWLTLGLGDGPVAEKARKVMESLYEDLKKL